MLQGGCRNESCFWVCVGMSHASGGVRMSHASGCVLNESYFWVCVGMSLALQQVNWVVSEVLHLGFKRSPFGNVMFLFWMFVTCAVGIFPTVFQRSLTESLINLAGYHHVIPKLNHLHSTRIPKRLNIPIPNRTTRSRQVEDLR
jgi:hypothetical protein